MSADIGDTRPVTATATTLRLSLHSVPAHAGWRSVLGLKIGTGVKLAIKTKHLRSAAGRSGSVVVAKSLNEALSKNKQTAFLCHSHKDQELAKGLQVLLKENGWDVYIDWEDNEMPSSPNKETASKIKSKITTTDWFLFLATSNSTQSRWCPWEIGYADSQKGMEKC